MRGKRWNFRSNESVKVTLDRNEYNIYVTRYNCDRWFEKIRCMLRLIDTQQWLTVPYLFPCHSYLIIKQAAVTAVSKISLYYDCLPQGLALSAVHTVFCDLRKVKVISVKCTTIVIPIVVIEVGNWLIHSVDANRDENLRLSLIRIICRCKYSKKTKHKRLQLFVYSWFHRSSPVVLSSFFFHSCVSHRDTDADQILVHWNSPNP